MVVSVASPGEAVAVVGGRARRDRMRHSRVRRREIVADMNVVAFVNQGGPPRRRDGPPECASDPEDRRGSPRYFCFFAQSSLVIAVTGSSFGPASAAFSAGSSFAIASNCRCASAIFPRRNFANSSWPFVGRPS